jgi:branched-chain amino acid transport system ATP-binding protein
VSQPATLDGKAPQASPAEPPLLEVNNIEVVYSDVILVLRGLSLAVPKGRSSHCSVRTARASPPR